MSLWFMPTFKSGHSRPHRLRKLGGMGWVSNVILWAHQKQATQCFLLVLYQSNEGFRCFFVCRRPPLGFSDMAFTGLKLISKLGWMASVWSTCIHDFFLVLVRSGDELQVLSPACSKHFTDWAIFPAPGFQILENKTVALTKCYLPPLYLKRKGTPA